MRPAQVASLTAWRVMTHYGIHLCLGDGRMSTREGDMREGTSWSPDGRLVAAGLRTFANIANAWDLTAEDVAKLLGVSQANYYRLQQTAVKESEAPPDGKAVVREQLADAALQERLSLLLGIYGDLQSYYAKDRAFGEIWVLQPNTNRVFDGKRPIDVMLSGRLSDLWLLRRFTQAMLQGQ